MPGRIGCKSIEITLSVKGTRPVELGVNPLRQMPVKFTEMIPNLTRQAHNVISVNF